MANRLKKVRVEPNQVKSGGEVSVDIDYECEEDETLYISCASPGFAIEPGTRSLKRAHDGRSTFRVQITRTSAEADSCHLKFSFFTSVRNNLIKVV